MSVLNIMADDGNILITILMGADVRHPTVDEMIDIIEKKNPVPDVITMEMHVPGGVDEYSFLRTAGGKYLYTLRRANGRVSVDNKKVSLKKMLAWGIAFKNQYGNQLKHINPEVGGHALAPVPAPHAGAGGGHGGHGGKDDEHNPFMFGGARRSTRRRRRSTRRRRRSTHRRRRSTHRRR